MKDNKDIVTPKDKSVEETVRTFYDNFGWVEIDCKKSGEHISFREFRAPYYPYHEGSLQRTHDCFSKRTGSLLIAGGGDMPENHMTIARQFSELCCLDISQKALDIAQSKLREKARYVLGSILEIPTQENTYDAVFCAHVIYHIDSNLQKQAIDEFIRVTKPSGRIVIIYSNPGSIVRKIIRCTRVVTRCRRLVTRTRKTQSGPSAMSAPTQQHPPLPFSTHPLGWWKRFEPKCKVTFLPWDVMGNSQEQILLRSDWFARFFYHCCSWVEWIMPSVAARWWQYPIIIIDKPKAALPPQK